MEITDNLHSSQMNIKLRIIITTPFPSLTHHFPTNTKQQSELARKVSIILWLFSVESRDECIGNRFFSLKDIWNESTSVFPERYCHIVIEVAVTMGKPFGCTSGLWWCCLSHACWTGDWIRAVDRRDMWRGSNWTFVSYLIKWCSRQMEIEQNRSG